MRLDRTVVDSIGELPQPIGAAADRFPKQRRVDAAHIDQPLDAALAQPLRGHGPDAPQRIDGQLVEKRLDPFGRDDRQAVRLLPSRRDLREELVRRHTGRRGQSSSFLDLRLEPLRDAPAEGSPHAFSVTSR